MSIETVSPRFLALAARQRGEHGNFVADVDWIVRTRQATIHCHQQAAAVRRQNRVRRHQLSEQLLDRARQPSRHDAHTGRAQLLRGAGEQTHVE